MTQITTLVYQNELTEQGLKDLQDQYPKNLVVNMNNESEFKAARKTRTERNKLIEAIKRRRLDVTADIKKAGDDITGQVENIYSVIVSPFEAEDRRRKEEAAKKAREHEELLIIDRDKIRGFREFIRDCQSESSSSVSSAIDAITNIDCQAFHKDVIHEAMQTKEEVLKTLGDMLTSKIAFEASERQRIESDAKNRELQAKIDAMEQKENTDLCCGSEFSSDEPLDNLSESNNIIQPKADLDFYVCEWATKHNISFDAMTELKGILTNYS